MREQGEIMEKEVYYWLILTIPEDILSRSDFFLLKHKMFRKQAPQGALRQVLNLSEVSFLICKLELKIVTLSLFL